MTNRSRGEPRHTPVTTSITTATTGGSLTPRRALRVGAANGIALLFDDDAMAAAVAV